MVKPAFAQTPTPSSNVLPVPSVPQFTIEYSTQFNDVPTTYSLNSSSGQIVAQIGYHEEYTVPIIVITNQPLVAQWNSPHLDGATGFYYNIRTSQHNSNSWTELNINNGYDLPSNNAYTNISIPAQYNGTLDIQVEALIGYIQWGHNFPPIPTTFVGQTSGWSNTQTATTSDIITYLSSSPTPIPSSSTLTPTSSPIVTPVNSSFDSSILLIATVALVVIAFLLVIIISLLLYLKKMKNRLIEK